MALRPGLAALHHRGFQDPLVSFHALLLALQIDGRYCGQALELHVAPLEVFVGHAKLQAQYRGLQPLLVHGGNVRSLQVLGIGLKEPRQSIVFVTIGKLDAEGGKRSAAVSTASARLQLHFVLRAVTAASFQIGGRLLS